jgi:hypothetical protein
MIFAKFSGETIHSRPSSKGRRPALAVLPVRSPTRDVAEELAPPGEALALRVFLPPGAQLGLAGVVPDSHLPAFGKAWWYRSMIA